MSLWFVEKNQRSTKLCLWPCSSVACESTAASKWVDMDLPQGNAGRIGDAVQDQPAVGAGAAGCGVASGAGVAAGAAGAFFAFCPASHCAYSALLTTFT